MGFNSFWSSYSRVRSSSGHFATSFRGRGRGRRRERIGSSKRLRIAICHVLKNN
ncbi:hypothetical protein D1AOALGA4SA_12350 [Olavius algarvensis Delta 1 endosymbiont]|nr:hypothetical protein D1AOALGA4SA_12350 [Olavius algarvensis Delta 1 endosymbiont]